MNTGMLTRIIVRRDVLTLNRVCMQQDFAFNFIYVMYILYLLRYQLHSIALQQSLGFPHCLLIECHEM